MTNTELESALNKSFAASAYYRDALQQLREMTKSSTADMYSMRRAISEALDAVDVGAQFIEILNKLSIENNAFREMFGSVNMESETKTIVH